MTSLTRVRAWLRDHPFAMLPSAFEAMVGIVDRRIAGGVLSEAQCADVQAVRADRDRRAGRAGDVAVVAVHGPIVPRMSMIEDISGGTSAEGVKVALDAALADSEVKAIVLDVDSPGGSVYGMVELADAVQRMRGQKPIVAIAHHQAASAAYWLASQADQLVVSPSGMVGSIGVIVEHWDESEALAKDGYRPTLITSSPFKAEGHTYAPLDDTARTTLQGMVDAYHEMFVKAVARGRGVSVDTVRGEAFGQGRMRMAKDALAGGMADRIETFEALVGRLQTSAGRAAVSRAAAEDWELRARAALLT